VREGGLCGAHGSELQQLQPALLPLAALLLQLRTDPAPPHPPPRRREQRLALGLSRGLLNLQLGKSDTARRLLTALGDAFPGEHGVALLKAVLLARDNKVRGGGRCVVCGWLLLAAACGCHTAVDGGGAEQSAGALGAAAGEHPNLPWL
jgi:hypothetical protein